MGLAADHLRRLAALRLAPEDMAEVLSIIADMQAGDDARKAKDRERKRAAKAAGNSEENPRNDHGTDAEIPEEAPARVSESIINNISPNGDINITPPISPSPRRSRKKDALLGSAYAAEFEETFWPEWPTCVDRKNAAVAFVRARMRGHSLETIRAGLARYKATKPEWQQWKSPAAWLNGDRFLDNADGKTAIPHDHKPIVARPEVDRSAQVWVRADSEQAVALLRCHGAGWLAARKKDRPGYPDGGYWVKPTEFPTQARA